ncbi:MAG: branched-chain amino acid ABC transporter permease [Chitinophagales bacterium]|nr:branched-chain amino acid ABC transporter permease [Chitinophagales bacterium]
MTESIQILLNSIVSGLLLSLVAIGFTYIFQVTKVFHLAHGGIYVSGAFACWWMLTKTNNWFFAVAFSILAVAVLIYLIEKSIYLPLTKKQSNQSISLIASMGLYVVIVNGLAMFFGNENKIIDNTVSGSFGLSNIIFSKVQMIQTIVGIVATTTFLLYLKVTKSNMALQAVSDNETISKVFGINTEKERTKVFIIGSILACIAAILKTMETGIDPQAGMSITLTAAVVAILVARLNVLLIIVFSVGLTFIQNAVEWFLNAQWKEGITFLILLLVILFKTEGIISYNLRKDRA